MIETGPPVSSEILGGTFAPFSTQKEKEERGRHYEAVNEIKASRPLTDRARQGRRGGWQL